MFATKEEAQKSRWWNKVSVYKSTRTGVTVVKVAMEPVEVQLPAGFKATPANLVDNFQETLMKQTGDIESVIRFKAESIGEEAPDNGL